MNQQTLVNALGYAAQIELQRRPKPARFHLKTQASKAALAVTHTAGLVDSITDAQLREVAALALAALEYVQTATGALERADLLAAAKGEAA